MLPCLQLVNNVIRNIEGAGFGVWGCYDCFYAHNTLISTGNRSHLVDIKFGEHSCDGEVESQCVLARSAASRTMQESAESLCRLD
jgi:Zn-finger protein